MKVKTLLLSALCLTALTSAAQESSSYELRTLSFEGENWSSLIDDAQYGGTLLYGDYTACGYAWSDDNNTMLAHEFPFNWYCQYYACGGHAISNYWDSDVENAGYLTQLSVYTPNEEGSGQGGHGYNGSDNFAVHYGYVDNSGFSMENLPYLYFSDYTARTIDHMYVNVNNYLVQDLTYGGWSTSPATEETWIKIIATGYDANLEACGTTEFDLVKDGVVISDWTKWDLSVLGDVTMVDFNVTGSDVGDYGFSRPAYFAYDNVAVRFPVDDTTAVSTINADSEEGVYYNLQGIRVNAPAKGAIYIHNGKKIRF